MSRPIEDYALLSDLHTAPLVSREGSIDWFCVPRFDSEAVFCALLGGPENGYWRLGICDATVASRGYVGDTFVLETIWEGPHGRARVTDFMPPAPTTPT
ncbi:trehalase-like domain-containing protein [Propioniciclava coleopterorum]|uniref:trehalase-like domain-containing protein n=1 Tax=Propioniciclava coleopterorum TaxID=2714937 RepID=UPI001FE5DED1|nr:trehalase-like domain-containing protein [Propioniciclava coleopterorum]